MNTNVDISIQTITPEIARKMLERNTRNRPRTTNHVKKLAKAMKSGEWKLNGEAIKFNGTTLVDGQHRLTAVIESGVAIQSIVVHNLDEDVFDTLDQGKKRTLADTFSVLGEKNCSNLASAIRVIDAYYSGAFSTDKRHGVDNAEADVLLEKYPEARRSVAVSDNKNVKKLTTVSMTATFHCIASRVDGVDPKQVDDFVSKVITGIGLEENSAEYRLREKLLEDKMSVAKLPIRSVLGYWIKAWNLHRKGKLVKVLRLKLTGDGAEEFPTAI